MEKWHAITRTDKYQALPEEAKIEAKRRFFERSVIPELDKNPILQNQEAREAAFVKFMSIPDDTGQGYVTSMLGSAGRGFAGIVPGAVTGAGALLGSETIQGAGESLQEGLESIAPVNPLYEDDIAMKGMNVLGNVGGIITTGGIGGALGKGLAAERIAAAGTQAARQALTAQAIQRGASSALYGTGFAQGAAQKAQENERLGMEGPEAYLNLIGGGLSEVLPERFGFGTALETSAARRLLGGVDDAAGKVIPGIRMGAAQEALEGGSTQALSNLSTQLTAPQGVETPGLFEGVGEAALWEGVGGAMFGVINKLGRTPPDKQTPEQQQWQSEINATPVDSTPPVTPEESQKNASEGGIPVVTPDGVVSWLPAVSQAINIQGPQPEGVPSDVEQRLSGLMRKPTDPGISTAKELVDATVEVPNADLTAATAADIIAQNEAIVDSMPPPPSEPPVQPVEEIEEAGAEVTPEMPVQPLAGEAPIQPTTPQENAIQEQITSQSLLREERPEMELPGMGEGNAQPKEAAAEGEEKVVAPTRDATKPEQMTLDEATERVWPGNKNTQSAPKEGVANLNGMPAVKSNGAWMFTHPEFGRSAVLSPSEVNRLDHQLIIQDALSQKKPVAVEPVDWYDVPIPEGYVKQGDLYIFQPGATGEPVQAAPTQTPREAGAARYQEAIDSGLDTRTASGLGAAAELKSMFEEMRSRTPDQIKADRMQSYEEGLSKFPSGYTLHGSLIEGFIPNGGQKVALRRAKKGVEVIAGDPTWVPQGEKMPKQIKKGKVLAKYPSLEDFVDSVYGKPIATSQTTTVATQNETAAPLAEGAAVAGGAERQPSGGSIPEVAPSETQETQPSTKEKARQLLEQKTEKLKETAKNKVRAAADEYFNAPIKDDGYPDFEPLSKLPMQSHREMIIRSWEEANPELVRDARKKAADEARKVRADEKDDAAHQSATTFKKDYEEEEMKASKSKDERRRALDSITAKDKPLDERPEVTRQDVKFAQQMVQKEVPASALATVTTAEEFLANAALTKAFPDIADGLRAGRIEGVFISSGHVFLFPENIIARQSDIKAAEELGIPVSVAAARRVILHESLVHFGFAGLTDSEQNWLIDWAKRNSTEADIAEVLRKYPRESNEDQATHMLRAFEERLAAIIEKTGKWPTSSAWQELKAFLRRLWNRIMGVADAKPTDKELLNVLRMLQSGSERMLEKSFAKTGLGGNVRLAGGQSADANRFSLRMKATRKALTSAALEQDSWKDWYEEHQDTLDEFFGDHAQQFQDILSVTSQAASVKANVGLALKAFGQWHRGEEFIGFLPAVVKNLNRLRDNEQIQGQKISTYKRNNDGTVDEAVIDRHITRLLFGVDSPSAAQFSKAQNVLAQIASNIGWTPRQVQAALWAHSIYKSGKTPESYGAYLKKLDAKGTIAERIGELALRGVRGDSENRGRGRYSPAESGQPKPSYSTADEARLAELYQNLTPELPNPAVREAYDKLATNQTQVAISDLRNESGLSKEDFAQSLQTLFDNGQAVLSPASSIEQQEADAAEYGVFGHGGTPASFVTVMPETNPQYESRTPIILKAGASTSVGGVGMASISPSDNSERAQAIREGISKTNWNELSTAQRAQALEEFGLKSISSRYFFDAAILPVLLTNERTGENRPASVYVAEPSPAITIQFDASGLSNLLSGDAVTAFTAVYDIAQEEVIHTAQHLNAYAKWQDSGVMLPFENFEVGYYTSMLLEMVQSASKGMSNGDARVANIIVSAWNLYNPNNPSNDVNQIVEKLVQSNTAPAFTMEVGRQLIQFKRKDFTTETGWMRFVEAMKKYLSDALEALKTSLGLAQSGKAGELLQREIRDVESILDRLESNPNSIIPAKFSLADTSRDAEYLAAVEAGDSGNDNLIQLLKVSPQNERKAVFEAWVKRNPEAAAKAQRMVDEAAKAANYDTSLPLVHHTFRDFTVFKMGGYKQPYGVAGWSGKGVWMEPEKLYLAKKAKGKKPNIAHTHEYESKLAKEKYADTERRMKTLRLYAKILNPVGIYGASGTDFAQEQRDEHGFSRSFPLIITDKDLEILKAKQKDAAFTADENGNIEEVIVFSPEQIKSADPVTYDNNGNVIQPSQRFQPKSPDIRFSLNSAQEESENESAQKAEEKIKSIGKTVSDIQAKANKAPWQGREIPEDVALANHPQVNKDVQGKLQAVARDIVEAQIRAGIPYEEMANEVTKPSFIGRVTKGNQFLAEPMRQFLLMEVGLAIQLEAKNLAKDGKRLDADILLSLYRDVIQAKENKASFASAMLNTQKFIINDENYSSIYIGNNIETLQAEERRKTVGTNAPGLADEVKAVDAAKDQADKTVKDAVEDIQERSDEEFAMEAMDAEAKGLWAKAKQLISLIGENVRELAKRGIKGFKASQAAESKTDKFKGVSDEQLKENVRAAQAELKAVLKKLLGVEETAPTKGTRKPKKTPAQILAIRTALFNSMAKEGLPVDLETAVAGIAPVRRTMWDTMVERIAKGVGSKVESIERKPEDKQLLNDLTNQLTRVLRDSVQGEKKEAQKESLGLRALRAFGYVTSNDQLVREAWETARENAVEVLADVKRAELGLPKLTEQLSALESDLAEFTARKEGGSIAQQKAADAKIEATQEQIKDVKARIAAIEKQIKALRPEFVKRRDELMSEVPRQFFATSQARSIIREALEDKYDNTKDLLDNVEEARQHVIDRLNEAVDKEGNVDPARWDRDSSFIKRAFDDMVADMRESLAKAEAKRIAAAREKLFSATEEEQIRIIQRKLNDLRPEEGGIKIPWDKLAQIRISEQKTLESQMFEMLKADPAFAGLPDSDLAKLSKIVSKVWQKKRETVIAKELKRIEARNDWSKKAKEAIKEHHPKIMRLINARLFDDNALYALIAEEYGFKELTPEQQARAIAITEKFMDPKTPRYVRAALQKEFKDIMMEVRGPTLLQTLNAVWYSSVLSSMRTMTTIALGVLNNGLTFIGEAVATIIANPTNPSKWIPILDSIDAIAKNLGPAAVDMWKYLKTGDSVYLDFNILNDPFYADQIKKGVALDGVDVGERMYRTAKNPVTKAIGWHVMVITRLLRVLDGFNTRLGKVSSMPFMYRRLTDEYDSSVVRALTDPAHYREKLIQDGVDPNSPALSALAMHAMHEDWDSQKGLLSNLEQNTNYNAAWSAMTGDPKGAGGVLYGSVKMIERFMGTVADTFEKAIDQRLEMMGKQGVEKDPLEDFIVRRLGKPSSYFLNYLASNLLPGFGLGFVRVVGNSLNQAISLIPGLGLLRVMENQDPRQKVAHRALLMRNQAFGIIGLMVMVKALKDIEDEPDDEKRGWFIEGNWEGLTPQQKAALFASGAQPNSIGYYKNGKRINIRYSEWPLASIFSLTGNLSDNSKYRPESWQTASAGSKAAKAVYYMWSSAFTMPAISQAMENLGAPRGSEDPFEAAERRIPKALASFAGGYIPRSIKDLDMWMQSETNRYKGWESLAKEIPFVRRAVGTEYLDVFGKQLETDRAPWSRVFTEGPDDPAYQLLGRLSAKGVWLSPPNPNGKLVGEGSKRREMTPDEGVMYQKEVGKGYRQLVLRYGNRLLQMPEERAKKFASQKAEEVREKATAKIDRIVR